ncbi:hypothetical protein IQ238_29180 [Pleurocapsales cyanobacterium LEGE 06147]|nr:hypothetical protein [Pleurocapsales cyanobacterium LEGE 06147]
MATPILPSQNTLPKGVILLEPDAWKLARPVLRGKGDSNVPALPDLRRKRTGTDENLTGDRFCLREYTLSRL